MKEPSTVQGFVSFLCSEAGYHKPPNISKNGRAKSASQATGCERKFTALLCQVLYHCKEPSLHGKSSGSQAGQQSGIYNASVCQLCDDTAGEMTTCLYSTYKEMLFDS